MIRGGEHVATWTPAFAGVTEGNVTFSDVICVIVVMPANAGIHLAEISCRDAYSLRYSPVLPKEGLHREADFYKC